MIATGSRGHAESVPGGHAIKLQLAFTAPLLERLKGRSQTRIEFFVGNLPKLRLGIVDVVNIHTSEIHVFERLFQLVVQVRGRHAVTAANYIFKTRNARLDEGFLNVTANVSRWRAVKRQITALGADDYLVARESCCFS